MDITITIDDTSVHNLLKTLQSRIRTMQPVMRSISEIMRDEVEENFAQQGRPKWKPLKASTIANRAKQGHWPGKILQMHGYLAASISAKATNTQAIVGTNVGTEHTTVAKVFVDHGSLVRQRKGGAA